MYLMPTMLKAQTFLIFGQVEEMCKLTIDNGDLIGEKIHAYIKFMCTTELNNI